ncbi:31559_t:CDS:2, partial [Gigaspora margarita]
YRTSFGARFLGLELVMPQQQITCRGFVSVAHFDIVRYFFPTNQQILDSSQIGMLVFTKVRIRRFNGSICGIDKEA